MNLKELTYITVVAETENISKAAEKLFMSQSSLSRWIQKIETDLGVELFTRTSGGLKITVAGEYYVDGAFKILQTYKEMENQVSKLSDLKTGRVTVGTTAFLGSYVLPEVLSAFNEIYPNIDISIVEGTSSDIEGDIIRGLIDLGILHTPIISNAIEYKVIFKERILLAVPPDDYLNRQAKSVSKNNEKHLDIRLTADRDYILTHPVQRTRQVSEQILKAAGIQPNIRYTTKSIQTASRLVAVGLGITLVPHTYRSLFSESISPIYYSISEDLNPYWSLIACYKADIPISKPAEEMLRIAQETLPRIYK